MPTLHNEYQLAVLTDGAVIRDHMGDVFQKRGGFWCGYETAPLSDHEVVKWFPAELLITEQSLESARAYYGPRYSDSHVQVAAMTGLPLDTVESMLRAGWTLTMELGKPTRWERQFVNVAGVGRTARYEPADLFPGRTDVLGAEASSEGGGDRG